MLISVILCTYNGERYLRAQLDSILNQTKAVDEIIISDDASTDHTKDIINEYVSKFTNIRTIFNSIGKGSARNFIETSCLAHGDIIFFCDQDDIWLSNKVEIMHNIMKDNPGINLLASSLKPFYEKKRNLIGRLALEKQSNNGKIIRVKISAGNINIKRSGCSMCIRASYFKMIHMHWVLGWHHDDFVWKCAVLNNSAMVLNKITVLRRVHSSNTSINIVRTEENRIKNINDEIEFSQIAFQISQNTSTVAYAALDKFLKFQAIRKEYIINKKIIKLIMAIFIYRSCYRTKGQLLADIYFVLKGVWN